MKMDGNKEFTQDLKLAGEQIGLLGTRASESLALVLVQQGGDLAELGEAGEGQGGAWGREAEQDLSQQDHEAVAVQHVGELPVDAVEDPAEESGTELRGVRERGGMDELEAQLDGGGERDGLWEHGDLEAAGPLQRPPGGTHLG